jgi:hypothetical protein
MNPFPGIVAPQLLAAAERKGLDAETRLKALYIKPGSPWQNAISEGFASARRRCPADCLWQAFSLRLNQRPIPR